MELREQARLWPRLLRCHVLPWVTHRMQQGDAELRPAVSSGLGGRQWHKGASNTHRIAQTSRGPGCCPRSLPIGQHHNGAAQSDPDAAGAPVRGQHPELWARLRPLPLWQSLGGSLQLSSLTQADGLRTSMMALLSCGNGRGPQRLSGDLRALRASCARQQSSPVTWAQGRKG